MVLPPADQVQQRMCSEWYNKQSDTFSVPVGMSASICQMLGEASTGNKSAPHYVCLNGTMSTVQVRCSGLLPPVLLLLLQCVQQSCSLHGSQAKVYVRRQQLFANTWNRINSLFSADRGQYLFFCGLPGGADCTFCSPCIIHKMLACLDYLLLALQVNLRDYYTISGTCPNITQPAAVATATPMPYPLQQKAAASLLLPLAHEFGMAITAYMADAQVDIASASQVRWLQRTAKFGASLCIGCVSRDRLSALRPVAQHDRAWAGVGGEAAHSASDLAATDHPAQLQRCCHPGQPPQLMLSP